MNKAQHLTHAQHNEQACQFLNSNGNLNDWVITTAFYAALHYVSHFIFPCDVYDVHGRKVQVRHLDYYHNVLSLANNKHKSLIELVEDNCNEIADAYEWLYSECMTARYSNYLQSRRFSQLAIQYLGEVRDYCTGK